MFLYLKLIDFHMLDFWCFGFHKKWCTATKNTSRMKTIYPRTLNLEAAVADPRIMGYDISCSGFIIYYARWWLRWHSLKNKIQGYSRGGRQDVHGRKEMEISLWGVLWKFSGISGVFQRTCRKYEGKITLEYLLLWQLLNVNRKRGTSEPPSLWNMLYLRICLLYPISIHLRPEKPRRT